MRVLLRRQLRARVARRRSSATHSHRGGLYGTPRGWVVLADFATPTDDQSDFYRRVTSTPLPSRERSSHSLVVYGFLSGKRCGRAARGGWHALVAVGLPWGRGGKGRHRQTSVLPGSRDI